MTGKLTRAEIPMCPNCRAEMKWENVQRGIPGFSCTVCNRRTNNPTKGYYPIDVAAMVEQLRLALCSRCGGEGCDDCEETGLHGASGLFIRDLANQLEGKS